jgi:hypothetical protein
LIFIKHFNRCFALLRMRNDTATAAFMVQGFSQTDALGRNRATEQHRMGRGHAGGRREPPRPKRRS